MFHCVQVLNTIHKLKALPLWLPQSKNHLLSKAILTFRLSQGLAFISPTDDLTVIIMELSINFEYFWLLDLHFCMGLLKMGFLESMEAEEEGHND